MSRLSESEISFPCAHVPADKVEFDFDPDDAASYGIQLFRNNDMKGSAYLTEEQARELFCWLGARLHGHRPAP